MAKKESFVKKEEKTIGAELEKEEKGIEWFVKSHTFRLILVIFAFVVLIGAIIYLTISHGRVSIENAMITAPIIKLSPAVPGILDKVFVKEGDSISADTVVAEVNGVPIKSTVAGIVVSTENTPGQVVSSMDPVVQMIDPKELRVVGRIQENKGLGDIKVGQKVIFTVDAFGSKGYNAIVESIGATSRQSDIVFSISDKRQEQEFDVTANFDIYNYPELKNGMSAKMLVYK